MLRDADNQFEMVSGGTTLRYFALLVPNLEQLIMCGCCYEKCLMSEKWHPTLNAGREMVLIDATLSELAAAIVLIALCNI